MNCTRARFLLYAYLAREEFAWSRRAFDTALSLDTDHEDALAGMGEALLAVGDQAGAVRNFERLLQLGFHDDHEMMLQAGRALFRCQRARMWRISPRWPLATR